MSNDLTWQSINIDIPKPHLLGGVEDRERYSSSIFYIYLDCVYFLNLYVYAWYVQYVQLQCNIGNVTYCDINVLCHTVITRRIAYICWFSYFLLNYELWKWSNNRKWPNLTHLMLHFSSSMLKKPINSKYNMKTWNTLTKFNQGRQSTYFNSIENFWKVLSLMTSYCKGIASWEWMVKGTLYEIQNYLSKLWVQTAIFRKLAFATIFNNY